MAEGNVIRVIVALAAIVWMGVAYVSGNGGAATAIQTFSYAGSGITLLFLAYDKWIWSWPFVRRLTGKPLLRGTWRGELKSDYIRDGKPIDPISAVIRVKQTNSSQYITLFTGESSSTTEQSRLIKEADGRWRLTFVYANRPRPSVRDRSDQHQGLCELYITGDNNALSGIYFTSRKTSGEMEFGEWCDSLYSDSKTALASDKFTSPKVFL